MNGWDRIRKQIGKLKSMNLLIIRVRTMYKYLKLIDIFEENDPSLRLLQLGLSRKIDFYEKETDFMFNHGVKISALSKT